MPLPGPEEVDDPGIGEPPQPGMVGRLPDGDILLRLLKYSAGHHGIPGKRLFRKLVEERSLAGGEGSCSGGEHRRLHPRDYIQDIPPGDAAPSLFSRACCCGPNQIDPHPDIPGIGSQPCGEVEDAGRHHPGVESLVHAVAEDLADLRGRIRQKADLGGAEDGLHRTVSLGAEVQGEVARDRKDPGAPNIPSLIEPEEVVKEGVGDTCRDEVVCVVEADEKGCIPFAKVGSDPIPDLVEVTRGGGVAGGGFLRCSGRLQAGWFCRQLM